MDTIDLKACLILEQLGAAIPGAQVEYERGGGMHRFVIVPVPSATTWASRSGCWRPVAQRKSTGRFGFSLNV